MASDVTLTGSITDAQKTTLSSQTLAKDFNQFLKLLTTQLQNQDPLNPMDSTEFTNQLVQFSQVEQSINTNQKLDNLVNLQLANIPNVALSYIGLDTTYRSAEMNWDGTNSVKVNYSFSEAPVSAKVNVYDEDDKLIYSSTVSKNIGNNDFTWDGSLTNGGKAEKGTYAVEIAAFDKDNKQIETSTAVSGRVRGIETQDGIVYLLIGERAVALGSVINATVPDSTTTTETEETGT